MWPNPQETADLVTFIKEILNRKLHFLCSEVLEKELKNFERFGSSYSDKAKKILFLPEMRVTRKIFPRVAANLFSLIDFLQIFSFFFFSLFCFFVFCFFGVFLPVCLFFEIKKYIFWYTFDFADRWVINKFSPGRFPETRILFYLA